MNPDRCITKGHRRLTTKGNVRKKVGKKVNCISMCRYVFIITYFILHIYYSISLRACVI